MCPGFGQDRVNFHQHPGRDTAGRADPTWPNRAGYSIPCASCWVPVRGSWGQELTRSSGAQAPVLSGRTVLWVIGLCCVFSWSVSLLLLFPLFAVLLNCPYPDPPFSACFFPFFSSAPQQGEGRPHGIFIASRSQTRTKSHNTWHKISVVLNQLTEKLTRSYLQQLQELHTSGRVMKMNKKLLPLANTFLQGFATISASGDKLRSLPVIKLCKCLTARHADYGIKLIYRCFFPSSHKAWRQHFSRRQFLCHTRGIHHTVICSSCLIYFLFIWQLVWCKLPNFSKQVITF